MTLDSLLLLVRLRLLSVQQVQSQKTYFSQLCTIMQHKSDFVLSGIIDVKLHVYHPFSVSPYIRVARCIYNRYYFSSVCHELFSSHISLTHIIS